MSKVIAVYNCNRFYLRCFVVTIAIWEVDIACLVKKAADPIQHVQEEDSL
jgi:hypothetical protein